MINVFDVAEYILSKIHTTTTMKLQKLVYYTQAWSLVWDEEPIIDNEFEAWVNGPVCRELYEKHKGLYRVSEGFFSEFMSHEEIPDYKKDTINAVVEFYGDKEPHYLIELTHKEDPWRIARGDLSESDYSGNIISKESMREYYSKIA